MNFRNLLDGTVSCLKAKKLIATEFETPDESLLLNSLVLECCHM